MTQFVTRKRLHMQYPPDPLDKWIARDIQLSPGGDYVDNTTGEALSTEEREEYERYQRRFHKRCKLGGKADRLVRIVDRYMPRIIVGAVVGLAEPTCNRTPDGKQYEEFSST